MSTNELIEFLMAIADKDKPITICVEEINSYTYYPIEAIGSNRTGAYIKISFDENKEK